MTRRTPKKEKQAAHTIDPANEEMGHVLNLIERTGQSVFLTGKAGTGKSTLLRHIRDTTRKKHVVLAPTGLAALNVGGQTIHSFFKLPLRPIPPDDPDLNTRDKRVYDVFRYTHEHRKLIRSLDLIIIDEVSMVRADMIDAMDKLLRVYTGHPAMPFGGVQMLFVGDLYQLEPVVTTDDADILKRFYPNPFFFSSEAFQNTPLVTIELTKVYRQTEQAFVQVLDRIRSGTLTDKDLRHINSRVERDYHAPKDELVITLATKRRHVSYINEQRLAQLPAAPVSFFGEIDGDFPSSSLPTEEELILKEEAQVIFVSNDKDRRWVNGTLGIVAGFSEDGETIDICLSSGEVVSVERCIWDNKRFSYDEKTKKVEEEVLGRFIQFPLKLAWAITVHKSQGLTFDRVIIDFSKGVFASGQAYVALSRCRSLEGMVLRAPLHKRDVIVRREIIDFYSHANDRRLIDDSFRKAEAEQAYIQALRLWNAHRYTEAVGTFSQALTQKNELGNPLFRRILMSKLLEVEQLRQREENLRREKAEQREIMRRLAKEYVLMGNDCITEAGDAHAAIRSYDKALTLYPDYVEALVMKGQAYARLNEITNALTALNQATTLAPMDFNAHLTHGEVLEKFGYQTEALDAYRRADGINPKSRTLLKRLISLCEELEDEDRAEWYRTRLRNLRKS